MKVAAYVRVSAEDQKRGDGPDGQRRSIQRWAEVNGVEVVSWHEDLAVSGEVAPFERRGVKEAVASAKLHRADGLVVDIQDRWTRGGVETGFLSRAELVKEHRLSLHITDMPFGMDTMVGQIILAVRDAMAADWLRVHKERVRRGVKAAQEKGWPRGKPGRPPKPDLTAVELDACLHMLNDGTGWPRMAHAVSKMRGAFDMATVEKMQQTRVTETWLRRKLAEAANKNPIVLLALERRGAAAHKSKVDVETGGIQA